MLLGIAADITEIWKVSGSKNKDAGDIGTLLLGSFMMNLGDKTFLRGITDFTQAALDPGRYMSSWAAGMVGTLIPNVLAQAARAQDPYLRDVRTLADTLRARVPGMREDLAPKLDIAGQPIERSLVEPLAATTQIDDPLAETMLRLGAFRGPPQRNIQIHGKSYEMTSEEYEQFKGYVQQARWNVLTPMVNSPEFRSLGDTPLARDKLDNVWDKVGRKARDTFLIKHPEIIRKVAQQSVSSGGSQYIQ
jgi:hypothetical protein